MRNDELYHYGVLGMKWGVRRQNNDRSLTSRRKRKSKKDSYHEDYKKAHSKTDIRTVSNKELQDINKRLKMEQNYKSMTKKQNIGKKAVGVFVAGAGTVTAIDSAIAAYKKHGKKIVDFTLRKMSKGG